MKQLEISEEDRLLLEKITAGKNILTLQESSSKYRELASGILLQYADSEMAGAFGYSTAIALAPGLAEKAALAKITYEKLSLAQKTYELVAQSGMNIDKYTSSHCFEARLQRNVSLGYRRSSQDKRVNALMYPLQGWPDLAIFTYLMASMACLLLEDFSHSSFHPWAELSAAHLPIEKSHKDFGYLCIEKLSKIESEKQLLMLSMQYWYQKVLVCFGPPNSDRNAQYIEFGLKSKKNEELACIWEAQLKQELEGFAF